MKDLADWAEQYIERNIVEVAGSASHPQIKKWIEEIENRWPTDLKRDDSTYAWCGVFVANGVIACGGTPPNYPQGAKRWKNYGVEVHPNAIQRGDVVITYRTGGHHVTVCSRSDKSGVYCTGGNQGNMVKTSFFPWSAVFSIRRPSQIVADNSPTQCLCGE